MLKINLQAFLFIMLNLTRSVELMISPSFNQMDNMTKSRAIVKTLDMLKELSTLKVVL